MTEYDLSVNLGGLQLKNPIVADSAGYIVSVAGMRRLLNAGYGAVVTKSATWEPMPNWPRKWEWSPRPRCYWDIGMDGTEALINPGYKRMASYIKECRPLADKLNAFIIGSFSPRTPQEAQEMARTYEKAGAHAIHMDMVCPSAGPFRSRQHPGKSWDHLGQWWSQMPERAAEGIKAVKDAVDIPVVPKCFFEKWAKENPEGLKMLEQTSRVDGESIATSRAPGGVYIDVYRGRPVAFPKNPPLEATVPYTVGNTMALAKVATRPIMAAGGVTTAEECVQLIMVGATAIGICRALYHDHKIVQKICDDLEAYMVSQALDNLSEIRGVALKHPVRAPNGLAVEHDSEPFNLDEITVQDAGEKVVA